MKNEFEQFQTVPELTLEPFKEEEPMIHQEPKAPVLEEDILSEDEGRWMHLPGRSI